MNHDDETVVAAPNLGDRKHRMRFTPSPLRDHATSPPPDILCKFLCEARLRDGAPNDLRFIAPPPRVLAKRAPCEPLVLRAPTFMCRLLVVVTANDPYAPRHLYILSQV